MLFQYSVFYHRMAFRQMMALVLVLCLFLPLSGRQAHAERATMEEARQVSQNWLHYMVSQRGQWGGEKGPQVMENLEIVQNDTLLGYYFPISPSGYIAVPVLKELPPIKAYSEQYRVDLNQTQGFPALLKEVLQHRIRLYIKIYGSLDAVQPDTGDVLLDRKNKLEWTKFLKAGEQFKKDLKDGKLPILTEVGPLLTTSWNQRDPYNDHCPIGDGGRCLVGCVATAAAQIMKYWNWPPYGKGDHTYWWNGDQSCGGSVGGGDLNADFSDPYDWHNMPNDCSSCNSSQKDALAELCYEVGVAFNTDYGVCESGAGPIPDVYPDFFRYLHTTDIKSRNDYTVDGWFSLIQTEINSGRPTQYQISPGTSWHSIVCDGWRDGGGRQYHMNYGWGGSYTGWYVLDGLQCPWHPPCDPTNEYMVVGIEPYKTLICGTIFDGSGGPLTQAGSPYLVTCDLVVPSGQLLTIQAGVQIYFESGYKMTATGTGKIEAYGASIDPIYLISEGASPGGMKLNARLRLQNGGVLRPGP